MIGTNRAVVLRTGIIAVNLERNNVFHDIEVDLGTEGISKGKLRIVLEIIREKYCFTIRIVNGHIESFCGIVHKPPCALIPACIFGLK